jgi:uncharacterized protein YjdB
MMVTVNPSSAITGPTSVNVGAAITLSNATTGGAWSSYDGSTAIVNEATGVVAGIGAGTTAITYTTAAGCLRAITVTVNAIAGRAAGETAGDVEAMQVDVYPNPTSGTFAIKTQSAGVLSIFDLDGKEAGRYPVATGVTAIQMPKGLAAGVYMCRFTYVNNTTTIIRLVYQP